MKRIHVWLLALMVSFSLTQVGAVYSKNLQQQLTKESTLEKVMKRGELRVGIDTFFPWAFRDKNGEFAGFEIDVAKQLAEDMGVKVDFVPTKWSGIIPALLTGKFDVIIGSMGIRTKRALKVNFTIPYEYNGMSIVANKKKAPGLSSLEDFNKPDMEIAVKMGTTAAMAAKKYMPKATLRQFEDEAQAYQEVRNGNVHAMVGSAPRPSFEAIKYSESLYLPIEGNFTKEPIAFALRKGDFDTLTFFNSWIQLRRDEGWLQKKEDYWFRSRDWAHLVE